MHEPSDPTGASIIVVGGSGGGLTTQDALAAEFAKAGITALALAYFKFDDLPDELAEIPLEYFAIAADWLASQPGVEPDSVTMLGISRGSEPALLTGCHFPKLIRGVIATVPGNVTLTSWPPGRPAWTMHGAALPYVGDFGPGSSNPEAVIAVEQIEGPLMLVGAGADEVWPSAAMATAIQRRRHGHGVGVGVGEEDQLHLFDDASHALGFISPTGHLQAVDPDSPDERARAVVWPEAVRFVTAVCDAVRPLTR
ncbi:MAG: acyl-CoA thioester hydrolase/BAAT C-terminal domain-containing protein [Microthrixaceae bacterium]